MSFVPGMKSALMELGRGVKSTPVHISFSKSENVELVLENERTYLIVLWVRRRSGKATEILETQAKGMVHLNARVEAPWSIKNSGVILIGRSWKVVPTGLEDC